MPQERGTTPDDGVGDASAAPGGTGEPATEDHAARTGDIGLADLAVVAVLTSELKDVRKQLARLPAFFTAALVFATLTSAVLFVGIFRLNDIATTNRGRNVATNQIAARLDDCLTATPQPTPDDPHPKVHDCYARSQGNNQFFRDQIVEIRKQLDRLERQ